MCKVLKLKITASNIDSPTGVQSALDALSSDDYTEVIFHLSSTDCPRDVNRLKDFINGIFAKMDLRYYLSVDCDCIDMALPLLEFFDGIRVHVPYDVTDDGMVWLNVLSESLADMDIDSRLFVATSVYDKYDISNCNLRGWSLIRKIYSVDNYSQIVYGSSCDNA